jgi:mediator of RNA polymerase II transcription subunit 12
MRYRATLASCIFPEAVQESPAYRSINQRNERLGFPDVKMELSPRRAVIGLLDKSLSRPFSINLPQQCREIMPDLRTLTRTVLDWATSSYRPGLAKVYVGARLLRTLSKSGIDVNEVILDFLGSGVDGQGLCKPSVYHLASELTRSGHFSVSKYIQWLIARGGVRRPADMANDGPCASRLLAELPMHDSPESICRLRRTMLSRASFFVEQELEEIATQTAIVEGYLSKPGDDKDSIMTGQDPLPTEDMTRQRSSLSRSIKSEIGVWIRKKVLSYVMVPVTPVNAWKEEKPDEVRITITLNEFNVVRGVLEDIGDLTMLADILKIIMPSDDLQVLASVSDTLNFHIEEFGAIGALNDLFDMLLARFRSMADENDSTILLAALANLAGRLPGTESVAQQLSQELLRVNRKTAADACSPVSEHMAEVLQSSESEFSDEVEKVLASGTYMETSTLKRLFQVIISRIEASWAKSPLQQRNCTTLLSRLRNFDMKQFDLLINIWLRRFLQYPKRPDMAHVLGPLISADCLDFREVIASSEAILENIPEQMNPSIASKVSFETLVLLLGTFNESGIMSTNEAYYLGIRRLHFQKDHPQKALSVIRRAVELGSPAEYEHDSLVSLCRSDQMRKFLRHTVLIDLDAVIQGIVFPLAKIPGPETKEQLANLVERLLDPEAGKKTGERTLGYRTEHTLRLADDLTLPFCQLELQLIFATEAGEWANEENSSTGCLEAFERAVDSAIASNNRSWTSIIPMLDIQIARHLCQRAERLLLQLIPSIKTEESNGSLSGENDDLAKKLFFVIHATTYSMQANRNSQLASQIVEKLNDIWQIASHGTEASRSRVIDKWLPLILDFITLHINMFDNSKSSSELRSRMLLSLSALLLELQTYANSSLLQRIFDVALLLVDDLPEEARLNCIRSLKDKTSNPRIEYIFGYSPPPTDWLHLSQNGKLIPYPLRRWEILSEPTPIVGENDTSLSLTLFKARKV